MATKHSNTPNPDPTFKHHCSLGEHGEILYDCPMEIHDRQDLRNYGITWNDCKTLSFNGSDSVTVYFFRTTNRALADYQWSWLDSQHSRAYVANRCQIPGTRKLLIRCPDTNSCARCPFGRKPEDRQPITISWDALTESGYEPEAVNGSEAQAISRIERAEIRAMMDAEDARIAKAFMLKEEQGLSARVVAEILGISEPRVYQLLSRAKAMIRDYYTSND